MKSALILLLFSCLPASAGGVDIGASKDPFNAGGVDITSYARNGGNGNSAMPDTAASANSDSAAVSQYLKVAPTDMAGWQSSNSVGTGN